MISSAIVFIVRFVASFFVVFCVLAICTFAVSLQEKIGTLSAVSFTACLTVTLIYLYIKLKE